VATLAKEYVMDYSAMLSMLDKGWIESVDTTGQMRLSYISAMMRKGETAPLEFCSEKIKDIIISVRKQQLIMSLERDLLNDARENGQFVIYQ
jgi:hypothetical protein